MKKHNEGETMKGDTMQKKQAHTTACQYDEGHECTCKKSYANRVLELEAEGLSTSDAQGVADVEARKGLICADGD